MKLQTAATLACLLVSFEALATDTRIQSLGGAERYITINDESGILYLPSLLPLFQNMAYLDIGIGSFDPDSPTTGSNVPYNVQFGFNYQITPDLVVAFYGSSLSRQVTGAGLQYAADWWPAAAGAFGDEELSGNTAINAADHKGGLVIGYKTGSVRLGALVSYWGDSAEITEPQNQSFKRGGSMLEVKLGMGFDLSETNSVDIAARFQAGWFDDDTWVTSGTEQYMATRLKSDIDWTAGLLARGVFRIWGEKVVPYAGVSFGGGGMAWNQPTSDAPELSITEFSLTAGADMVIKPLEGVMIVPGIGIMYHSFSVDDTGEVALDTSNLVLPYFGVSLEAAVTSFMSIRGAARQHVIMSKIQTATTTAYNNDTETDLALGLGFKIGQVDIDWMIDPKLLIEGPDVVGGQAPGFATQASVRLIW